MAETRHTRLDVLKAAAITIPFVREVERQAAAAMSAAVKYLRSQIESLVDTAEGHAGGLGTFLASSVGHLQMTLGGAPTMTAMEQGRVRRLLEMLSQRSACDVDPQAYQDGQGGPALAAALSACVPEIDGCFEYAGEVAKTVLAGENLVLPEVLRATSFAAAIRASCVRADLGTTQRNQVTLVLPERGFDRRSLYAAPYLLTHELVCHAAQGIEGPLPRHASGKNCPWSDGWMDCLAYEESVDWLSGPTAVPAWVGEARALVAQRAEDEHVRRYEGASPAKSEEADQSARIEAKQAWIALKQAAMDRGRDEAEAITLRRSFSLTYNALNMNPKERSALVLGLWVKLQDPETVEEALRQIERFLISREAAALHRAFAL